MIGRLPVNANGKVYNDGQNLAIANKEWRLRILNEGRIAYVDVVANTKSEAMQKLAEDGYLYLN